MEFLSADLIPLSKIIMGECKIDDAMSAMENARNAEGLKHIIIS